MPLLGKDISLKEQIASSSIGALLTSIIVTPMDVVKIRLQSQARPLAQGECFLYTNGLMDHLCVNCEERIGQGNPLSKCEWYNRPGHFTGTFDALAKITRHEGITSLWSGLSPTMLSAIPATVFYFTIYDNILTRWRARSGDRLYIPLISGGTARAIAVIIVSPMELVRTKMQSQKHSYSELKNAVKRTVSADGYSALWRGCGATLLREIPFSATYWSCYEFFKKRLLSSMGMERTNFGTSFVCGAGAGAIAAVLTMPFDVVKTHQQLTLGQIESSHNHKHQTTRNCKNGSLNGKNGVSALYTGMVPRLMRVAPSCAIMIGTYEYMKSFFARRKARPE
ncbi:mitochondrial carrier protein [Ditylenchus destructor]|nr:mitochondrial carrier protein [Ditylenchus destructor]